MSKRGIGVFGGAIFVLLIIGGVFWYVYQPFYSDDKIFPGIKILGMDVGGMNKDDVNKSLENKINRISNNPVSLYYKSNNYVIYPKNVNFSINKDELYQQAMAIGRSGGFLNRFTERWRLKNARIDIQPDFKVSENRIKNHIMRIAKGLDRKPQNAKYLLKDKKITFVNEVMGLKVDLDKNIKTVETALINGNIRKYPLEVQTKEAQITKKTFRNQGITGTVASFTTSFKTSQESRKYNIRIAAEAFNNLIIKPQAKFSFNKIIKQKQVDKNYKVAKIIKNNKFVLGDGGGVCQVSTTLYNSVLLANLKIVERAHHSVPVRYVPLGQDATVSENISDFKFQNSSENSIMVLTHIVNDELTFYILGTPTKRKVSLVSQLIKKESQDTNQILDNDLPKGLVKTEKGSPFYEVKVFREIYNDNRLIKKEEISHDKYKKVDNEIRIGTAYPW